MVIAIVKIYGGKLANRKIRHWKIGKGNKIFFLFSRIIFEFLEFKEKFKKGETEEKL